MKVLLLALAATTCSPAIGVTAHSASNGIGAACRNRYVLVCGVCRDDSRRLVRQDDGLRRRSGTPTRRASGA